MESSFLISGSLLMLDLSLSWLKWTKTLGKTAIIRKEITNKMLAETDEETKSYTLTPAGEKALSDWNKKP
jgi:hypothetical protein